LPVWYAPAPPIPTRSTGCRAAPRLSRRNILVTPLWQTDGEAEKLIAQMTQAMAAQEA